MLNVCHLYPELLNLYGDRGNIIALRQRCLWRVIPVTVQEVNLGDTVNFKECDVVFLGGGSERKRNLVAADLMKRKDEFKDAVENGLVVLAICSGYQLLGNYFMTQAGEKIPGLGILDFYTGAGTRRLVGNVAIEVKLGGLPVKVLGFENHSAQTYLGDVRPLGKVLSGYGNNGKDGLEGARYKNVFCSYLHGPLLPKNTSLTDYLISLALQRRGIKRKLKLLNDSFENNARAVMLRRLGL